MQDPDWLPYRAMRRGLDAFARYHALAPDADARFVLRPQTADSTTEGLMLRIVQGDNAILVPVMADGSFSLPPGLPHTDDNAELVLNRKKDLFRWRPWIQSPDLPRNTRRLGDLRLECQVLWALEQATTATPATGGVASSAQVHGGPAVGNAAGAPVAAAGNTGNNAGGTAGIGAPVAGSTAGAAAATPGPCASATLALGFPAPSPLAGATLQSGGRSLALRLSGKGNIYFPPLSDTSWPDDALIQFTPTASR